MKYLLIFLILSSALFAETADIDFDDVELTQLKLIKKLIYGKDLESMGISIPVEGVEDLPFGPNAFTKDGEKLFITDNMNRRVVSMAVNTKEIAIELRLPDVTYNNIFFKDSKLILHNSGNNKHYQKSRTALFSKRGVCMGAEQEPLALAAQITIKDKSIKYPDLLILGPNKVKLSLSKDDVRILNFKNGELSSISFSGKDESGNLHFKIEIYEGKVVRYHAVYEQDRGFISKTKIPFADLYVPEKDLVVDKDGSIFVMVPDKDGVKFYKGGVKWKE